MKKTIIKNKLVLTKQPVRLLTTTQLTNVVGGLRSDVPQECTGKVSGCVA